MMDVEVGSSVLQRKIERIQHIVGGRECLRALASVETIGIRIEGLKLQAARHPPVEHEHQSVVLGLHDVVSFRDTAETWIWPSLSDLGRRQFGNFVQRHRNSLSVGWSAREGVSNRVD